MITVDRQQYMNWVHGTFLTMINGRGPACNEGLCQAADDALQHGERVWLTRAGNIVSEIFIDGDGITEAIGWAKSGPPEFITSDFLGGP